MRRIGKVVRGRIGQISLLFSIHFFSIPQSSSTTVRGLITVPFKCWDSFFSLSFSLSLFPSLHLPPLFSFSICLPSGGNRLRSEFVMDGLCCIEMCSRLAKYHDCATTTQPNRRVPKICHSPKWTF